MKPQTIDDLSTAIRSDLGWRRRENQTMQSFVRGAQDQRKQAALRGAVAVLYAHWEGFVKYAGRSYYEFVKMRRLTNHALAIPFLAISIEKKYGRTDGPPGQTSAHQFIDWLLREWDRCANLPTAEEVISTSNLNSAVLRSIVMCLGLPYEHDYLLAEKPVIDVS